MLPIAVKEWKDLFTGIRSFFLVAVFTAVAYLVAQAAETIPEGFEGLSPGDPYAAGLTTSVLSFGLLFVLTMSHHTINKEVESSTVRFLVTKTSRANIILGKLTGTMLFWSTIIFITALLIAYFGDQFHFILFLELIIFLFYCVSLTLLLSVLVRSSSLSMFLAVILALVIPILSFWAIFTENIYVNWFKFFTPYYYLQFDFFYMVIPFLLGFIFLSLAGRIFQGRDV